jgi:hypothetical protein
MNDLALQNAAPGLRTMFVNCLWGGWVIRFEPIWLGGRGFSYLVKVDVRLVSFACLAFEMTRTQNHDSLQNFASSSSLCCAAPCCQPFRYLR